MRAIRETLVGVERMCGSIAGTGRRVVGGGKGETHF